MKKHIKKIICLVAVLVICVSAFVVPSFAYGEFIPDRSGSSPYIGILPTVEVSYQSNPDGFGGGIASYTDTPPPHLISGFTDDIRNNELYHTNFVLNDGTITYGQNVNYVRYGIHENFLAMGKNVTYLLTFPQAVVEVNNEYPYFPKLENIRYDGFEDYYVRYNYSAYSRETGFIEHHVMNGDYTGINFNPYNDIYQSYQNTDVDYVIVSEIAIEIKQYSMVNNPVQPFDLVILYGTTPELNYTPSLALYDDTIKFEIVNVDGVDVGTFLWNSVMNFLNLEIVQGVSLYELFIVIVSIPLCIWLLKLFAGG